MNRMKHLICVFLLAAFGSFSFKANAYTERDMLQKAADETDALFKANRHSIKGKQSLHSE